MRGFCVPLLFLTLFAWAWSARAFAETPLHGLAVAVSSDGGNLVAGGSTRTLLVLDPNTLEVRERTWIGLSIVNLSYNSDGTRLAVVDTRDMVTLYDTADWREIIKMPSRGMAVFAPLVDKFAAYDSDYSNPAVHVHSLADGSPLGNTVLLEKGIRPTSIGISPDGKKLAVLTTSSRDDSEPRAKAADMPQDLKGLPRTVFQQRNDGQTSQLLVFDLVSNREVRREKLWYSSSDGQLFLHGDKIFCINYRNENAEIGPDGEITLFELTNSHNYAIAASPEGGRILTGGLRHGSFTELPGLEAATFEISQLPSWPEYFKGFSATTEGAVYGSTDGYRVIRFSHDGLIEKEAPVK